MTTKPPRSPLVRRPVVGLALSGGGARGLAHIGVLKVLENAGIPVDCLAGTSMGGVIAALSAAGYSALEIEEMALHQTSPREMLKIVDLARPRAGLLTGEGVRSFLADKFGEDRTFDDLRVPLGLVAVDLISGEEVVLREGCLIDAIRATGAFPVVFSPVQWGDRILVDGGVLNNLPVDVARQLGAEVVIAVNVNLDFYDRALVENPATPARMVILHNAWRTQSLTMAALTELKLRQVRPRVILHPHIPADITAFQGFGRAAEIIAAGEQAATDALDKIRRVVRPRLRLLPRKPRRER